MANHTKVLITGASGFVAGGLVDFLRESYSLTLTSQRPPADEHAKLEWIKSDLTEEAQLKQALDICRPDVVIHCAGLKDVKLCEADLALAFRLNAQVTASLARACRDRDVHLIYLSTDLVFSGIKGGYRETDMPEPSLVYGKSKLQGEVLALSDYSRVSVCRTAGVFGARSPLLSWFREKALQGSPIECFTDVHNSPTSILNLSRMLCAVIEKQEYGILHTVGSERASRLDLFRLYAASLKITPSIVRPAQAGEARSRLLMLSDSSLSNAKTLERLKIGSLFTLEECFSQLEERNVSKS